MTMCRARKSVAEGQFRWLTVRGWFRRGWDELNVGLIEYLLTGELVRSTGSPVNGLTQEQETLCNNASAPYTMQRRKGDVMTTARRPRGTMSLTSPPSGTSLVVELPIWRGD
jgi:hypothetical protein